MTYIYFAHVAAPIGMSSPLGRAPRVAAALGNIVDAGSIKIGVTENLRVRMRAIGNSVKQDVDLLAAFRGSRVDERRMHRMFAHLRVGGNARTTREWFAPAWELGTFIESSSAPTELSTGAPRRARARHGAPAQGDRSGALGLR